MCVCVCGGCMRVCACVCLCMCEYNDKCTSGIFGECRKIQQ